MNELMPTNRSVILRAFDDLDTPQTFLSQMFLQFDKLGVADIFRVDLSGWSKKTGQGDIQFPKMAACFRILTSPVELLNVSRRQPVSGEQRGQVGIVTAGRAIRGAIHCIIEDDHGKHFRLSRFGGLLVRTGFQVILPPRNDSEHRIDLSSTGYIGIREKTAKNLTSSPRLHRPRSHSPNGRCDN